VKYTTNISVSFQHVDWARIVFYPRYFEMFNQVVEQWFDEALGCPFHRLHQEWGNGIPLVDSECRFRRANHLGDQITFELGVLKLGRCSFTVVLEGSHRGELCVGAQLTMVWVTLAEPVAAIPIPQDVRRAMKPYLKNTNKQESSV
jgi:4-hydroxybenzoyl-CoA thioesterase|tara:strand:+ start:1206 stop:1643 length:438 start_codon:yes stop_codon:yes gene_type:complete